MKSLFEEEQLQEESGLWILQWVQRKKTRKLQQLGDHKSGEQSEYKISLIGSLKGSLLPTQSNKISTI